MIESITQDWDKIIRTEMILTVLEVWLQDSDKDAYKSLWNIEIAITSKKEGVRKAFIVVEDRQEARKY